MKIKWNLFQRAMEENYPICWVLLRIKVECNQRNSIKKTSDTVNQRIEGYRRKRSRRNIEKRCSIYKNARRTLLSRIPITNY